MARKRMTIAQIADAAGVTKGTVSKILNKKARFSPEVTERVTSLLEDHGHLARLQRRPVCLITRYADGSYPESSSLLLLGAIEAAASHGISLDFRYTRVPVGQAPRPEQFDHLRHQRPGAILLDTNYPWTEDVFALVSETGLPTVQCGFENHSEEMPAVVVDSLGASYQATRQLIAEGHRRIATIRWQFSRKNPAVQPRSSALKHAGFLAALQEAGIALPPNHIDCIYHLDEGKHAGRVRTILDAFLALPEPPTAVFIENSYCSLPALFPQPADKGILPKAIRNLRLLHFEDYPIRILIDRAAQEFGYRPPPSLLVTPCFEAIGKAAVDLLASLFHQSPAARTAPVCHKVMPVIRDLAR